LDFSHIILFGGLLILATHCMEGITGFGATIAALPFIAMMIGIKTAVPVMTVLGITLSAYIVLRHFRSIDWRQFRFIILCALPGLPFGMALFDYLPEIALKALLAVLMTVVGLGGIRKIRKNEETSPEPVNRRWWMAPVLFFAGIVQGAFGTAGPLVVIYAAGALPDKAKFRATLSLFWLSANTIRIADWTRQGIWNTEILKMLLCFYPFLLAGLLLGDYLHAKVNVRVFRLLVYAVLLVAGVLTGVFAGCALLG
jgi:hypothetical protein